MNRILIEDTIKELLEIAFVSRHKKMLPQSLLFNFGGALILGFL